MSDEQTHQLAALLRRVIEAGSPYYQLRAIEAGGPDARAWHNIEPTTRADLVRDQLAHLPHGSRRLKGTAPPVRAGCGGSGADLLVLTWTAHDLEQERAAGVRTLQRLGVRSAMRVANTLPGALATPGCLLLGDVIEDLGALDVPLGVTETEAAARQGWELVDRIQPHVLVLDSRSAATFLSAAPASQRPWLAGVVLAGTAPYPTAPAAVGFNGWWRRWLAVAEARSFVAAGCAAGSFHVDEEIYAEVIEPTTVQPLPAGASGMLLLTPLQGDTPLLRFQTDLRARLLTEPCACGIVGQTLEVLQ